MRRQAWASPAFWAPRQFFDEGYDTRWRARVAAMLEAREDLDRADGAGEPGPGAAPFELLAEWEGADGEVQDASVEALQECIAQQVRAYERDAPEWWLLDPWGHVRQDVQAEWERDWEEGATELALEAVDHRADGLADDDEDQHRAHEPGPADEQRGDQG